ncbi:RNA polymerase sigma factor [Nannocystis pusilla]|uniref:RNA polymerase sigma factor n=1 Tax=Nannocystis pusilla TaxID=889268 RepID=UPI003B81C015
MLGDDARAQDVVQDTFVSLLARPEQFAGRSAFSTWLYSAVTHRCLNILRDQGNRARLLDRHAEAAAPSGGHGGRPRSSPPCVRCSCACPPSSPRSPSITTSTA